ncbi:hypothetical protein Golob_022945, partial [Gossypium lobatum]|nr:hypothetical protein [Gossypium lobatum]
MGVFFPNHNLHHPTLKLATMGSKYEESRPYDEIWETVVVKGKEEKQICVGRWIHQNMKQCSSSQKVGIFFPHLVIALCKKAKEDEAIERDFQREEDDYDVAFQPYYSIPKRPIIRNPTRDTHTSGGGTSQGYVSGKGKAPIERGQLPHFDDLGDYSIR